MSEHLKQTELLNEQLSAENEPTSNQNSTSNNQTVYEEKYGDTGLYIRGNENGFFATCGNYIIIDYKPTLSTVKNLLDSKDYSVLFAIIDAFIHHDKSNP